MRAVIASSAGDPDVLTLEELADPTPGPGQVAVQVAAVGVNFIDTYHRRGTYPLTFPSPLGSEGAGTVVALGEGVAGLSVGDAVAWATVFGSYAERIVAAADALVAIPSGIDMTTAAAAMLQGLTAHYLTASTFPLGPEHTALVHAGAGGAGQLIVQMAKRRGARVLTTVSTEEKADLARAAGADEVIRYTEVDFAEAVRDIAAEVDVVYDSVGSDTFDGSLACLRRRGTLVLFGQSSGAVAPFDPQVLNQRGSLFLTRPTLADYTATPAELRWRASELFAWIADGSLRIAVDRTWPLAEAADAHRYLEDRRSKGKLLLLP